MRIWSQVVFLADILDEARARSLQMMQADPAKLALLHDPELSAEMVGLSAVVVQVRSAETLPCCLARMLRC